MSAEIKLIKLNLTERVREAVFYNERRWRGGDLDLLLLGTNIPRV